MTRLLHRPWLKSTSPLRSQTILHIDAYVRGDANSAYLDIHATLGGTRARARDVLDITSFPGHMVALEAMPDGVHVMTWTARETGVPWARVHRYVRHIAEALHPRGLGTYPWLATSLLCHYVAAPDHDPFLGRRRRGRTSCELSAKGTSSRIANDDKSTPRVHA
jgi:hypothetical protein